MQERTCATAAETLEWINEIVKFIAPYDRLINAHVTDFFTERLWEAIDEEWMECLVKEAVRNLLLIPSGVVQEKWPESLREFVQSLSGLAFPREQGDLSKISPGVTVMSLSSVLSQGMNAKKKYEVEVLAAVVSAISQDVGAETIIDVGSGQGYLSQVLSFRYGYAVVAVDSSSHHGTISSARAQRIKKHCDSQTRKSWYERNGTIDVPKSITRQITSMEELRTVPLNSENTPSLLLAGLHACGDLSATMLRTFCEWKEVKAIVSVGCCYNLLTERGGRGYSHGDSSDSQYGFPMSDALKAAGVSLGKNARDLACQSAKKWSDLNDEEGVHNFELHAFRAAFQIAVRRYFPAVTNPAVGREGKALRRKQKGRPRSAEPNEDGFRMFERFCVSALARMGVEKCNKVDFLATWKEVEPYLGLIGPYWSLRAAFGPVLETLILLDRLLFLQQHPDHIRSFVFPIFDPSLSPRNVAIVSTRT